ncbi:hypothetical protein RB596_009435 [Gaeumannomyces avenae]
MNRNDRQRAAPPATSGTPQQPAATTRNNEYFLPRDGIDREVITADICRYLGNDALVRPGHLEKNDRIIQGYYITAYRNLTSAMIESLKEDSQKWVEEKRRAQGAQGAQMKYMDSMLRNPAGGAQHMPGPSRDFPAPQPPYNDPYSAPGQGGFGQYPPRDAGYPAPNAFPPREAYDDRQDPYGPPRGNPGQYAPAGYQAPEGPYMATGMNFGQGAPQQFMGDHQRAAQGQYPPTSQAGGGYAAQPAGYYMGHAGAPPPPAGAPYDAAGAQSRDVFHGRASPAGTTGFSNPGLDQQYEHPDPSRSRASATPTAPSTQTQQVANSGNQPARRDHNRPEQRYSNTTRR